MHDRPQNKLHCSALPHGNQLERGGWGFMLLSMQVIQHQCEIIIFRHKML